ncbi:MAG TPA: RNA 2'-phosphotransferase [Pyrinomonadaceae bacterium]|nr:RNA 2'-phosphotransferase [Pyrinomonadaceae bacterium]
MTVTSKFLSLVLRHQPELIGLTLDEGGWADVADLIDLANRHGREIYLELIREVVATNNKKRFAFNDDGTKIRANQGHSVDIELGLSPAVPPRVLYHGTATRFLESIKQKGLNSGTRLHVHLSADVATAVDVGRRHGKPVVLKISSLEMHEAGHKFYFSENGVWLTRLVPVTFINMENL